MRLALTCVILLALLLGQEAAAQNIPYFTPTREKVRWFIPPASSDSIKVSQEMIELTERAVDTLGLGRWLDRTQRLIDPVVAAAGKDERIKQLTGLCDSLSKAAKALGVRLDSVSTVVKKEKDAQEERVGAEETALRRMAARSGSIERIQHYRDSLTKKVEERFEQKRMVALVQAKDHKDMSAKVDSIRQLMADSLAKVRLESEALMSAYRAMHRTEWVAVDGLAETTRRFYDPFFKEGSKFLQSNILTLSSETGNGALYSEIFHDYIGPLRVGFGGLLSNVGKSDTTEVDAEEVAQDQAQRILGGGGNAVATFGMPLVGYTSITGLFMFRTSFQPKLSLDLTRYAEDQVQVPFHSDLGLEFHTSFSGRDGILSFFASARPSLLIGNPAFYGNLAKGDLRSLAMAQVRFGIGISNVLRISYSINAGDAFIQRTFPSQLAVTILTTGLKGKP